MDMKIRIEVWIPKHEIEKKKHRAFKAINVFRRGGNKRRRRKERKIPR